MKKLIIILFLMLCSFSEARISKYQREINRLRLARYRQFDRHQKELRRLEIRQRRWELRKSRKPKQRRHFHYKKPRRKSVKVYVRRK